MSNLASHSVVRTGCALVSLALVRGAVADVAFAEGRLHYAAESAVDLLGASVSDLDRFDADYIFRDGQDNSLDLMLDRDLQSVVDISQAFSEVDGRTRSVFEPGGTSFELHADASVQGRDNNDDLSTRGTLDWTHEYRFEVAEPTRIEGTMLIAVDRATLDDDLSDAASLDLAASITIEGLSEPISITYSNDGDDFFQQLSFGFMAVPDRDYSLLAQVEGLVATRHGFAQSEFDGLRIEGDLRVSPAPGTLTLAGLGLLVARRRR